MGSAIGYAYVVGFLYHWGRMNGEAKVGFASPESLVNMRTAVYWFFLPLLKKF